MDELDKLRTDLYSTKMKQLDQENKAASESVRVQKQLRDIAESVAYTVEALDLLAEQVRKTTLPAQSNDQVEGYKKVVQEQSLTIQDLEDTIADKDAEIAELEEQLEAQKTIFTPPALAPNIYISPPSNGANQLPKYTPAIARGGFSAPSANVYEF